MPENRVRLLMVLTAVFWSGAFITGKLAVSEFPPFALTFFRFALALPFIFLLLYIKERATWLPHGRQWLPLIKLGIIGTFCYHVLFFASLKYTTAINSSLIGATNPMVTTLLAVIFFGERLTLGRYIGIALSFMGIILVVTNADLKLILSMEFNIGDILMFIAVFCFAIYALLSRRYMKEYALSPIMVTAYTFLFCIVVSIPFVVWENPLSYLPNTTTKGWLSILYMSVFASVLGYLFQMVAIKRIGAPKAAIFVNLVPVFTIVQSIFILGESFTIFKFMSAMLIIIGVYLATRPEKN